MASQLEVLVSYIRDELGHSGDLHPDSDLLGEEILDSFSIVELAVFVQQRLGVELEPDDLSRSNFSSLRNIMQLVDLRSRAMGAE
jgi:acyl carrier protein